MSHLVLAFPSRGKVRMDGASDGLGEDVFRGLRKEKQLIDGDFCRKLCLNMGIFSLCSLSLL